MCEDLSRHRSENDLQCSHNRKANLWAMACHLAGLTGLFYPIIGNIIPPLVIWLIEKDRLPFVDKEGKEAVNFQISIVFYGLTLIALFTIYMIIGIRQFVPVHSKTILAFLALVWALFLFMLVEIIIAAVRSSNGKHHSYPLKIRFIK